jgi:YafQ family addiction module toxin component
MIGKRRYKAASSDYFRKDYVSLVRKNKNLREQIDKKMLQVLETPEAYKNLRTPLQSYRRVHVGSFVITFRIDGDFVRFVRVAHHDKVYGLAHD